MIFFGWYTFLIKRYFIEDLGIPFEAVGEEIQIEVRQRCFHLFWIPFFSLGKFYAMRREDGELYDLPPEFKEYVRAKRTVRTPWYTYIGVLFLSFSLLLHIVSEKYEKHRSEQRAELFKDDRSKTIEEPIVGDQYTLSSDRIPNRFYAKIATVKSDSVLLKLVKLRERTRDNMFDPELISFKDEDLEFEPQWVTKDELLKAAQFKDSLELYIPELGGIVPYVLIQLRRGDDEYSL